MYNRRIISNLAIFSVCCLLFILTTGNAIAADSTAASAGASYTLNKIDSDVGDDKLTIRLVGNAPPAFTSRELYDPYRLIIDIADAAFAGGMDISNLIPANKFTELQTTVVKGVEPEITRFIFTISSGYTQTLVREGNDLVIEVVPGVQPKPEAVAATPADSGEKTDSGLSSTDAKIRELIESSVSQNTQGGKATLGAADTKDNFSFSGYKKERITVDFYKIDLHNVFRLLRQISGVNLIVDESVKGTLTLALKDVPWDFALDIILNLKDLAKEEKFNTIVIYPKDREFDWPQHAADNLTFEENLEVTQQEALIIEQSANQPKEVMQAKDLMRQARKKEQENDYEDAADLYEQAYKLWPKNDGLATRISALYLVRLGMNAKSLFFAKKSLEVKPEGNYKAALYAAIASANMNKMGEAVEFFNQSISGNPPMKEALGSFAAFSESSGRYESALQLYNKYNENFGESVTTMVAKARIYDRLGNKAKADEQYKAILASGFQVQNSLRKYIESRLSGASN